MQPETYPQPIPEKYYELSNEALFHRISSAKKELGDRLLILGHHYQRDEIIQFADYRGDSLKLSQLAASRSEAEFIIFCGVHFMAESADILSGKHQKVFLPDLNAGCHMADMANIEQVENCWQQLSDLCDSSNITPITYINSTADLKAFCGKRNGVVCTSSNAEKIIKWSMDRREKLFFFPDEHLGRNSGVNLGFSLDEMIGWNAEEKLGGNRPEALIEAKIILWRGNCPVHQLFTPKQIKRLRRQIPELNILVHPECSYEVAQMSDLMGSTAFIIETIENAPANSKWAIGTEMHLINRLAAAHPDKFITSIDPNMCLCTTMNRIDMPHLSWLLDNLLKGEMVNQIVVPEEVAHWAKISLDRMLEL